MGRQRVPSHTRMCVNVQVIPAIEEAIIGMKVGGVRRLIVPQELGYPGQPPDFTKQGPTPGNFSVRPNLHLRLQLRELEGIKGRLHATCIAAFGCHFACCILNPLACMAKCD